MLYYIIGFAVYFGLFFVLRLFIPSRTQSDGLIAWGIVLAAVCALFAFGITRTVTATFPDGIYQNAFAYFVLVPAATIGVCMAVVSMIGQYNGRPIIQGSILFAALLTGIASGTSSHLSAEHSKQEKEDYRAEMELTNVSGTFGESRVSIPVSPLVSIGTRCDVERGNSGLKCSASFDQANTFEYFYGFGLTDLNFSALIVWNPGQECRIKSKCEQFKNWCARRPDMAGNIWCWSDRKVKVEVRNDRKYKNEEDFDVPLLKRSNPVGALRIRCREGLTKPWCRAHFEVAPDVRAIVTVQDIETGNEEAVVLEAVSYAQSLWAEMTSHK